MARVGGHLGTLRKGPRRGRHSLGARRNRSNLGRLWAVESHDVERKKSCLHVIRLCEFQPSCRQGRSWILMVRMRALLSMQGNAMYVGVLSIGVVPDIRGVFQQRLNKWVSVLVSCAMIHPLLACSRTRRSACSSAACC
jgi:hypothetical protein